VCVEQTAAELCSRSLQVHVAADACTSRSQEDRLLAFEVRASYSDHGIYHFNQIYVCFNLMKL
jgi:nicotinamidase-related amidase